MKIVWAEDGDKNCNCAAIDCQTSGWTHANVYSFTISTTATTTVWPWVVDMLWDGHTCYRNCKCAADGCTPSEWQWAAVYQLHKTTTTTVSTTSTAPPTTTTTTPAFHEVGVGCCADSAGLSPSYSHERAFTRPQFQDLMDTTKKGFGQVLESWRITSKTSACGSLLAVVTRSCRATQSGGIPY